MRFDDEDDDEDETDYSLRDEDDGDTIPCSHCGREIYDEADRCPYCGAYVTEEGPAARRWPWWMWLGLAGAGFVVWRWIAGS